jgi:hypothetical protein
MNGLLNVAFYLAGAPQIRAKPTAGLDADALERASTYLDAVAVLAPAAQARGPRSSLAAAVRQWNVRTPHLVVCWVLTLRLPQTFRPTPNRAIGSPP